jgi:hypothetical protein
MERKKMMHLLREAQSCLGSHDDFPTMPAGTDPMPCLSRNRTAQPFFLVSAHDQVVLALAGKSRIELPGAAPDESELDVGDAVYVPAGQPSRIVPETESVHLRFKAEPPGWEAAVWICASCGTEIFRRELDATAAPAQAGYWQACQEFNRDSALRTCACGTSHPPADVSDVRWPDVAAQLAGEVLP